MMITTTVVIGFKLPDEYEAWREFINTNGMSEWTESISTVMTCYRREQTVFIDTTHRTACE